MSEKKAVLLKGFKGAKLVAWTKSILSKLKLEKSSRAGIVLDTQGTPQLFIFDTPAFLDVLSTIDEALVDKITDSQYHSKAVNPSGWLIDEIEARLPLNKEYIHSLKEALKEANKKGWIPFSKIHKSLCLK